MMQTSRRLTAVAEPDRSTVLRSENTADICGMDDMVRLQEFIQRAPSSPLASWCDQPPWSIVDHGAYAWKAANPYKPSSSRGVAWHRGRMAALKDLAIRASSAAWRNLDDGDLEAWLAAHCASRTSGRGPSGAIVGDACSGGVRQTRLSATVAGARHTADSGRPP
jgi:hypothetical protein